MFKLLLISITLYAGTPGNGEKLSTEQYIEIYAHAAMENMRITGVPASITLAQGILESSSGNSPLAREANNHFGIKCHKEWSGPTYIQDDDEKDECFRKYSDVLDSYKDHAHFLTSRERYKGLFLLEKTDYQGWAHGLKAAGYATNPNYAPLLIGLIERYQLAKYDKMVLEGQPDEASREIQIIQEIEASTSGANSAPTKKPEAAVDGSPSPVTESSQRKTPTQSSSALQTQETRKVGTFSSKPTTTSPVRSQITFINGLKVLIAGQEDNEASICEKHELSPRTLSQYNDWSLHTDIKPGTIVFLEPKRNAAAKGIETHLVKEGETWHSISQSYGVSLKWLLKRNGADLGSTLTPGTYLRLRP